jgi:exodeoxyribonuclease-3
MIVGCLYAPNGNPQPGPKFDYKLAWMKRLHRHAAKLLKAKVPVVLAGDYNVAPTDLDIYPTTSWDKDALIQPKPRAAYTRLLEQGWTDALREHYGKRRVYTFWTYWRNRFENDHGLRIDHLLLSPQAAKKLKGAGVDRAVRGKPKASDHAPAWIKLAGR